MSSFSFWFLQGCEIISENHFPFVFYFLPQLPQSFQFFTVCFHPMFCDIWQPLGYRCFVFLSDGICQTLVCLREEVYLSLHIFPELHFLRLDIDLLILNIISFRFQHIPLLLKLLWVLASWSLFYFSFSSVFFQLQGDLCKLLQSNALLASVLV